MEDETLKNDGLYTPAQLVEVLENTGICSPVPYSGKMMFGKSCVGFTCEDLSEGFAILVDAVMTDYANDTGPTGQDEMIVDVCEPTEYMELAKAQLNALVKDMCWDDFGLRKIVYFPSFKF